MRQEQTLEIRRCKGRETDLEHLADGKRRCGLRGHLEFLLKKLAEEDLHIYWGAYIGTEEEVLVAGKLSETMGDIERIRAEKREQNGWIMDTYLLRKPEK
jgi:precorrin-2 methylase